MEEPTGGLNRFSPGPLPAIGPKSEAGEFQPDVILLDIGLPKVNGYEACQRIRKQPWGKNVVLIGDRKRIAAAPTKQGSITT
jgi:CheY-like chemotaxis protein